MADEESIEQRIRDRAYKIWQEEGCPDGKELDHWELARMIVGHEDGLATTLKPAYQEPSPESAQLQQNLGEFPTLVDQGEEQTFPQKD